MPRKKVSTDSEVIEGIADIDDDEQLVEETTRKVRRERVSKPKPEPPAAAEIIDIDDDDDSDDIEPPPFSQTSLAAKIYTGDDNEQIQNQFCTVNVRRNPDSMNDHFAEPNKATLTLPPLRNIEITTEQSDIEETVRQEYGGGHYFFQIHFNGSLGPSWKTSLSDLPTHLRFKAQAAHTTAEPTPAAAAQPAVDPLDTMLNSLAKMKALKDALFGDEEARMQDRIVQLERQIEERPEPQPNAPLPENLQILEKALATQNSDLQTKLLDYAFPPAESSHWIADTLKVVLDNKEKIVGLLGGLLGGLVPKPPPPTQQGIAALLASQPPAAIPAAPPTAIQPSHFTRKNIAPADDGEKTDAGSGDDKTKSEETENVS